MSIEPFRVVTSNTVIFADENIDTDQIIPARFLKVTTREGLGQWLFAHWRYHEDGTLKNNCILNQPYAKTCQILIGGDNFGCGSSREHAPWALRDFGFRVVISTSIADIFRNNATKNGLLPVVISPEAHAQLLASPQALVTVDLETCTVQLNGTTLASFEVEPFARYRLLNGIDEMTFLLNHSDAITRFENARDLG
jgi:3-isopropylmalate/(R)-2-methylmalate dehydratase small subunit